MSPSSEPVTVTPSGSIRGSWLQTRRGRRVQAYRGVRYAAPPTGELRFHPPKPILQYPSEVDAKAEGPACPQPVIDPDYFVDEDCLRLNVYTPEKKLSKPLPVVVYIHSGGFYSVSGRSDVAGPDYLLDKDLVLVTINYRLASLGFLSTGDKHAPGNNGFKDQVVALQWVQRNIAAFGGDPRRVTISGCSAGAFSVMLHMVSPMSKGLFHRAVSISGSPISQVAIRPHQKELAIKQAQLLNCPTDSSEAIMSCLKTKPWRDIGNSLDQMFTFGYDPILVWAPIVEPDVGQERFLTEHPLESVNNGRMHAVPYIIGQTTREFFWKAFSILDNENYTNTMNAEWERIAPVSFLLPPEKSTEAANRLKQAYLDGKPLTNDSVTADGLGKLYGDSVIGFGVHRLANLMCRHSPHKVFYYEFSYVGNRSHYEDPVTGKPVGAAHHDDLIYLFGLSADFPAIPAGGETDSRMVDLMTGIMYNFADKGDPNPLSMGPSWPAMTPNHRQFLSISSPPTVQQNMFEDRFRVWDEIYPIKY
ncbi:unnamed protein product [Chilo suppressalis]|uniref:Carboxylic ester hydrolase n=1 Tax=Chilo suppressalis TaxID=168631 RepID=A0ABN8B2L4_CHISP|nr:unnamed protein product [Chilo suppressalis]